MSSGPRPDNKAASVGVTATISIVAVVDLIGNTLVILIILNNRSMKSPMNYLLVNLAVADIIVGVFFWIMLVVGQIFPHPEGLAGAIMCSLLTGGNFAWVGGIASAVCLVSISFERYFVVMHPYITKYKLNLKKVKGIVALCWTLAIFVNLPHLLTLQYDRKSKRCIQQWSEHHLWLGIVYGTVWIVVFGVIPVTIMFSLYSRVIYTLWFKRPEHQVQGTQLAMLKSRKRVTKMVVTVSVIYAVCWLPDSIIYVLYHYKIHIMYMVDVSSLIGLILVTCNSAVNPFIYSLQSQKFRIHLKELVCCSKSHKSLRPGQGTAHAWTAAHHNTANRTK